MTCPHKAKEFSGIALIEHNEVNKPAFLVDIARDGMID